MGTNSAQISRKYQLQIEIFMFSIVAYSIYNIIAMALKIFVYKYF